MNNKIYSLQHWLEKIDQCHFNQIDLGLERIKTVAERLKLLPWHIPTVTVAGTNGKGSTVCGIEHILTAEGYKVGCYTSPHLLKFNERIRLSTQQANDQEICNAFETIEQARENITLTYFEFATLAALFIFKNKNCDVVVLEVGMGGRLDAVNIIDPQIAVITNIAFDHQEYLGDTLEKIGAEKAGIFRKNIPVVFGDTNMPESVLNRAEDLGCKIYVFDQNSKYQTVIYNISQSKLHPKNVATSLMAVELLKQQGFKITEQAIQTAIQTMYLPGRFEQIKFRNRNIILDVAHNPDGINFLKHQLKNLNYKKIIAVFSMLKDKDIETAVAEIKDMIDYWHVAPLNNPRAAEISQLKSALEKNNIKNYKIYEHLPMAFSAVLRNNENPILAFGSFYTIAEIKELCL